MNTDTRLMVVYDPDGDARMIPEPEVAAMVARNEAELCVPDYPEEAGEVEHYHSFARWKRTRSSEDFDTILVRARLRRERRLAPVVAAQGWFPTADLWTKLDLVHEATYLIDRLERVQRDREDAAAEVYA